MRELLKDKKQWIYTYILTIILLVYSMGICKNIVFDTEAKNINFYHFIIISFAFIIFVISFYLVRFVRKLITGDAFCKKFLKHFLIYLGLMAIFLLLIWPGYWVWDEMFVIYEIQASSVFTWQSIITQLVFAYSLLLISSPVGITIIQVIIISLIVAFLNTKVELKFGKKLFNVIIYVVFLLPAILINNLYVLRLQLYTYFLLLLSVTLIFDYLEKKQIGKEKLLLLYLLSAILILWRSEGLIFIFAIPVLMAITYKNLRKVYVIGLMIIINICTYIGYSKIVPSNDKYGMVIFINPLSIMLQEDLQGENIQEDLEKIDKVFNLELIKENPNYNDIESYWKYNDTLFQEDYQEYKGEFYKAYADIIINNPISFINARLKTFLATNGMDSEYREIGNFTDYYSRENPTNASIELFLSKFEIMNPINKEVKNEAEMFLLGSGKYANTVIRPIFWNVVPVMIGIVLIMIISLIKKKYIFTLLSLTLLAKSAVVFLTAPASYFMYYLPEYICGIILILLYVFINIRKEN